MLVGDDRSAVELNLMPDPRAIQFWDGNRLLGAWLTLQEGYESIAFGPIAWDTFLLYGPEAEWSEVPGPLLAFGRTILSERDVLEKHLFPFLRNPK